jgi:hypothetical protein
VNLYGMADSEEIIQWLRDKGVEPLYLMVSGSHSNGLARPDSDLDIRGVYLSPIEKILSLAPGRDVIEGLDILGGKTDIQVYELKKALGMLLKGNGNAIHMFMAPTCFYSCGYDWRALASKFITKKLRSYFAGYHQSQRKRAAEMRGGKSLLYSYREILSGIMLARTGSWIFDFRELKQRFEETFCWRSILLDGFMAREDWKQPVAPDKLSAFAIEWEYLVRLMYDEFEKSSLPDDYDGYEEMNSVLLTHRAAQFINSEAMFKHLMEVPVSTVRISCE